MDLEAAEVVEDNPFPWMDAPAMVLDASAAGTNRSDQPHVAIRNLSSEIHTVKHCLPLQESRCCASASVVVAGAVVEVSPAFAQSWVAAVLDYPASVFVGGTLRAAVARKVHQNHTT